MSSSATNYLHNAIMGQLLKGQPYSAPSSLWVALYTTVPALTGSGGVEVSTSGTAYGRVQITAGSGWTGPSGTHQEYSNTNDINYQVPTGNWGTITGIGLFDQENGGNPLWVGALASPKSVSNGDGAPKFLAGQLKISRAYCG